MNGIYDFEQYKPPYLDVEMLEKRREQRQRVQWILLSVAASVLMVFLCGVSVGLMVQENTRLAVVLLLGIAIYVSAMLLLAWRLLLAERKRKQEPANAMKSYV